MPRDRSAPAALSACSEQQYKQYKSERPIRGTMLPRQSKKASKNYYQLSTNNYYQQVHAMPWNVPLALADDH
jgi:hypothetical protein